MFKHFIKIAFRSFRGNPFIFAGSIVTVFLCALCISLLFTYVHNELTMDNFHQREKDIYLMTVQQSPQSQVELMAASRSFDFNFKEYPEIENLTRLQKYNSNRLKFVVGESVYSPEGLIADSSFFKVFDFKLKIGDETTILSEPGAVILTEELAEKIFSKENPIGKKIEVIDRRGHIFTVKGIVETPPSNSSIEFDFILSRGYRGFSVSGADFILVNSNFKSEEFSEKIKDIGHSHVQYKQSVSGVIALDDMYFASGEIGVKSIFSRSGDKSSIRTLMVIIAVIFIISILNFSNLQIIQINSSLKNIGVNKITGAGAKHILLQKITEILVLVIISAVLITFVFVLALPFFNKIAGVGLAPELGKVFMLNISILILLVGFAMVYPSVASLRIPITNSLKSQVFSETKLAGRKVVSSVQFALTIVLLIISIVVVKQLDYMLNKDLGFKNENIIATKYFDMARLDGTDKERQKSRETTANNYEYVKNELATHSTVKQYSQGQNPLNPSNLPWKLKGSERDFSSGNGFAVTPEYFEMLGLEIIEGRFFERERDESRGPQVVINEAAKKFWEIEDISKAKMMNKYWAFGPLAEGFEVIGVVKSFNCEHLSTTPQPMYLYYMDDIFSNFLIEFEPGATQAGLQFAERLFTEVNPGETFQYTFLSDEVEALYHKEKQLSQIYIIFTFIAFLISVTGLFAISLYDTKKRTKEIGLRKVHGARTLEILTMLNKDFLKWVAIAFLIATPVAYYTMQKWLENFAYKTTLSWWIFALAGLLALGIALLTVSFQSWKAASKNPIESLRYE
jgi:putative ABC transport system permease protein